LTVPLGPKTQQCSPIPREREKEGEREREREMQSDQISLFLEVVLVKICI
jgi:hypothetical protein